MSGLTNLQNKLYGADTKALCIRNVGEYMEEFDAVFEDFKEQNASVTKYNLMLWKRCCEGKNPKSPYDARNMNCEIHAIDWIYGYLECAPSEKTGWILREKHLGMDFEVLSPTMTRLVNLCVFVY